MLMPRLKQLVPLAVAVLTTACPKVPDQTQSMQAAGVRTSGRELRTRNLDLGHHAAAVIESAADSIRAVSADPEVRANALRWKAYVIPQIREAALRPDPFAAALDLTALVEQLDRYFTTGGGRTLFGDQQAVAVGAVTSLLDAIRDVRFGLAGGQDSIFRRWNAQIDAWVSEHPIADSRYTRPTPIADMRVLAGEVAGIGGVAASMENELRLLQERLAFVQDYGAADLAWRMALGIEDAVGDTTLDSLRALVIHSAGLMGTLPDLVTSERAAILEGVTAERIAVMREIRQHLQAILAAISSERAATLDGLGAERAIVLDALSAERAATLAGMDSIVQHGVQQTRSLVNHTLLIVIPALAAGIVLAGAAAFVVVRYARPTG